MHKPEIKNNHVYLTNPEVIASEAGLDWSTQEDEIKRAVKLVQDEIIDSLLGRCLYEELKQSIAINDCSNECYMTLLRVYIQPIFVWGVKADLALELSYKLRNAGMIKMVDSTYRDTTYSDMSKIRLEWLKNRDKYILRAAEYIKCNKCFENKGCPCVRKEVPFDTPFVF